MKKFLYMLATDKMNGGAAAILKFILWILSGIYGFLILLRGFLYKTRLLRSHKLPVPVLSVGNLTMGGVGKTPLVAFIAQRLKRENILPVILIRGYMDQSLGGQGQTSDEATMLRRIFVDIPILIGANRAKRAKEFLEEKKADVFLLDDGFQHWRVQRQLDIVAIDATDPWGNGHLLPRGVLREPKRALLRADVFALTKTDLGASRLQALKDELCKINPKALIVETVHAPVALSNLRSGEDLALESLQGEKIAAVCGIGSPDSFMKTLTQLGAQVVRPFSFMDHYSYVPSDVAHIVNLCKDSALTTIVTTEKDAVKLKLFLDMFPVNVRVLSLRVKISIVSGEDQFFERINHIL